MWIVRNSWGQERVPENMPQDLTCLLLVHVVGRALVGTNGGFARCCEA